MNNQEFLDLLRRDPNRAFKKMYRYFPAVQKYVKENSGSKIDAQDIFQDGLLLLHSKSQDANFELTSKPETYLFSLCKYLWQNQLRKKSSLVNSVTSDADPQVADTNEIKELLEKEEKLNKIEQVLNSIGVKCKKLLELFYRKSKSMLEISNILGFKSEQSTKTQKYKCVERVRKEIINLNQTT